MKQTENTFEQEFDLVPCKNSHIEAPLELSFKSEHRLVWKSVFTQSQTSTSNGYRVEFQTLARSSLRLERQGERSFLSIDY